jgi:hypothetical protein
MYRKYECRLGCCFNIFHSLPFSFPLPPPIFPSDRPTNTILFYLYVYIFDLIALASTYKGKHDFLTSWSLFPILSGYLHFHVHYSTIDNSQEMETTQVPIINEWIMKIWYTYTQWNGIPFSHKKNKILSFWRTWLEPEIIRWNEVIHAKKGRYCMILLKWRI